MDKEEEEAIIAQYKKIRAKRQKQGMDKKAREGHIVSRAPFGYEWKEGKLVPGPNAREVEDIFNEFLDEKTSLRKIAKKHQLSVNGLKKILTNFSYLGKVKFDGQVYDGVHEPILSSTLFNHAQNKLKNVLRKEKEQVDAQDE